MLRPLAILLLGLFAHEASADLLSVNGTVAPDPSGVDVGVLAGDRIEVNVDYDPSVDPVFAGTFLGAISSMTIAFPDRGIEITGTGTVTSLITLTNDNGNPGVVLIDSISFGIDGVTGTLVFGNEVVNSLVLILTEQLPGVDVPDLVTSASVLPAPPLDFDSAGPVTMGVAFDFVSLNNFAVVSLDPVQVPEPSSGASAVAALLPLVLFALARRRFCEPPPPAAEPRVRLARQLGAG